MRPETFDSICYKRVDDLVRRFEAWLIALRSWSSLESIYSRETLNRRIAQAVCFHTTVPFCRESIRSIEGGAEAFPDDRGTFRCENLTFEPTGSVRPGGKLLIKSLLQFSATWLLVLAAWVRSIVLGKPGVPAVLLFGVPEAELKFKGSDRRFVDYCLYGPLALLTKASRIITQAPGHLASADPNKFHYAQYPLLKQLSMTGLGWSGNCTFLRAHFWALWMYASCAFTNPLVCLLWRDLAEHAAAAALDEQKLISGVVLTNTNWQQQLLWMSSLPDHNFRSFMALYSLNISTLSYKDAPIASPHPGLRHLMVDEIWVWNEEYREVLRSEGIDLPTAVTGPILWYLPNTGEGLDLGRSGEISICVFDITPKSLQKSREHGTYLTYVNTTHAIRFLCDVVATSYRVADQLKCPINVLLKHKRPPVAGIHDGDYTKYVDLLASTHSRLVVVPSDTNIYSMISEATFVVVFPFSSPAYIASGMGVPAVYYDCSASLLPNFSPHPKISFARSQQELEQLMISAMSQSTLHSG